MNTYFYVQNWSKYDEVCDLIYRLWWLFWSFVLCSAWPEITRVWILCDPSLRLNLIDGIKSRTWAEGGVWCGSWRSWEWGDAKASAPVTHSLTHSSHRLPDGRDPHTPLRATHTGMWHWCASRRQSRSKVARVSFSLTDALVCLSTFLRCKCETWLYTDGATSQTRQRSRNKHILSNAIWSGV